MTSLKTKALDWLNSQCELYSITDPMNVSMDKSFYFKLEGFADEPEVYIRATEIGLEFGYETIQWEGYMISTTPSIFKKHTLIWEELNFSNKMEQLDIIVNFLIKTINSRKRQYRKCQFCNEKVTFEHRFDKDTCQTCASDHLGVVY
ncbi:hypothetical protein AAGS61_17730 [Lysinibacillus sp. KU-BSD001]|uniref:hypothetical protein n=1 Tax=Lysinibacillus sp. KU-BSD001 TaxID=3141328 RepID=UPI0036E18CB4